MHHFCLKTVSGERAFLFTRPHPLGLPFRPSPYSQVLHPPLVTKNNASADKLLLLFLNVLTDDAANWSCCSSGTSSLEVVGKTWWTA